MQSSNTESPHEAASGAESPSLGPLAGVRFVGVVHLLPLPGAPRYLGSMAAVLDAAARDAAALAAGGAHAVIVENFGDVPFRAGPVDPETAAAMALAVERVGREVGRGVPLGVNVLRNDARCALGIAAATGARFVRVNVHSGAAVCDQGLIQGRADETLRVRAALFPDPSTRPAILADVHVKHAAPLGASEIGRAALDTYLRGLADGLVVSGDGTGAGVDTRDLVRVREVLPDAPLFVGSGFTPKSAATLFAAAGGGAPIGAIVGTYLKVGGHVAEPVETERVAAVAALFRG